MAQIVEILPRGRQGLIHPTLSVPWFLMTLRRKESRHQQLRNGTIPSEIIRPSNTWVNLRKQISVFSSVLNDNTHDVNDFLHRTLEQLSIPISCNTSTFRNFLCRLHWNGNVVIPCVYRHWTFEGRHSHSLQHLRWWCIQHRVKWKEMLTKFSSLAAPKIVNLTTFGAPNVENFVKMTFPF